MGRLMKFMSATVALDGRGDVIGPHLGPGSGQAGLLGRQGQGRDTGTRNSRAAHGDSVGWVVPRDQDQRTPTAGTGPQRTGNRRDTLSALCGEGRAEAPDGGDHHGLDGVHAVLGFVEDHAVAAAEDLVGDLRMSWPRAFCPWPAWSRSRGRRAGSEELHVRGLPVFWIISMVTLKGVEQLHAGGDLDPPAHAGPDVGVDDIGALHGRVHVIGDLDGGAGLFGGLGAAASVGRIWVGSQVRSRTSAAGFPGPPCACRSWRRRTSGRSKGKVVGVVANVAAEDELLQLVQRPWPRAPQDG